MDSKKIRSIYDGWCGLSLTHTYAYYVYMKMSNKRQIEQLNLVNNWFMIKDKN